MVIWAAAATAACMVLILILIMFVRQMDEICRRLAFIGSHETNMRLTSETPFRSVGRLIDGINAFLEEDAEERAELARESRGLKESLTGISHDIRTPLTSLSGYFQLLTGTEDPEERERYGSIIRARIGSLETMLEELFTYTKLQDSDYKIEMHPVNFTQSVIDTLLAFYGQFAEKGVRPEVNIEEAPAYICGDGEAVRRILQNILKNALVHGTEEISLSLDCRGDKVVFRCTNRCAAPEEIDIEDVFRKFYKADPARKDTSTGLGLTIASGLAERLGGELTAKLEGDRFTILLGFKRLPG